MARALSRALIRAPSSFFSCSNTPPYSSSVRCVNHRNRSNRPEKKHAKVFVVDLEPNEGVEVPGMRRLEDAIYGVIVKGSAPDWLPFIPGSSYWVPPLKRPLGIVELVGKAACRLTEEEAMSLMTVRGWPSSAYFFKGSHQHPVKLNSESKQSSQSEDEEG